MVQFSERRKYQRCTELLCKAMSSRDEKHWTTVEVRDISAGGLSFCSYRPFELNCLLHFEVCVYNMLSEFKFRLQGRIVRKERTKNGFLYGIMFEGLGKHSKIQLDELIRSKCIVPHVEHYAPEDGTYTFLFVPRIRPARLHLWRR